MVRDLITFVLQNLPAFLLALALILGALPSGRGSAAERLLRWVLLLPIGVTGLWAGFFHLATPDVAAAMIGWQPSPFQFEVAMADLAIGITAILAVWRGLDFKLAAIVAAGVFLLGDAVGHVRQMIDAGNFAPGNAGVPFVLDIVGPLLAALLWAVVWRQNAAGQVPAAAAERPAPST
jgi:hypothetical protein